MFYMMPSMRAEGEAIRRPNALRVWYGSGGLPRRQEAARNDGVA